MRAMVLTEMGSPLQLKQLPQPIPAAGQLVVKVHACGVCRTDLHLLDNELPAIPYPIIPGHEIVGRVISVGKDGDIRLLGQRVGIPWLGYTCGCCHYCINHRENLCEKALFTGYTLNGGYADYVVADSRYCFVLPDHYTDVEAAPLLCAGLIGYRALRACGQGSRLGIYGFGAAAHLVVQIAQAQGWEVYAFTRPNDSAAQQFARQLGAVWAGSSDCPAPVVLDTAIIFAAVGALVPTALSAVDKGGTVVCAGIHMSDIPAFPYSVLWGERRLCSIANLTRNDGLEFFALAAQMHLQTHTVSYPLEQANTALDDLRQGHFVGAAVLVMS